MVEDRFNDLFLYPKSTKAISKQFQLESSLDISEDNLLHKYRDIIHDYEEKFTSIKNWEFYKKIVNPYEFVYTQKKYDCFPESICQLNPLSRSYFKMIEMMEVMHFFLNIGDTIKSAHVCEGPGGFIEALISESQKHNKRVSLSIAMTLKSKQNQVPGWKRASSFLKNNQNVKIIYGEDHTGDILKPENQQYFIDYASHPHYGGKVDIFTADGGFDFSCNYFKQEEMVFPLLMASVKIGLEVLKKGGVFILKVFDFYHKSTTDLLYLLSYHFNEWSLYKPCMSRPCNPEHYFIGRGFTGCSNETLDAMRLWCLMPSIGSLLKMEYPDEFIKIIQTCRNHTFESQSSYLEKVFQMIDASSDELIKSYIQQHIKKSHEWCMRFHVPISLEKPVVE